jgi:hypothetical protein
MGFLSWLGGGNDRELAATRYAGRESATDRATRVGRERRIRSATKAARKGQQWEDADRRKHRPW